MKVRSGRAAAGADIADDLALLDAAARGDAPRDPRHVGIGGVIGAVVANADIAAVGAEPPGFRDHTAAGGNDRCAGRRREIHTLVHPVVAADRMFAHAV